MQWRIWVLCSFMVVIHNACKQREADNVPILGAQGVVSQGKDVDMERLLNESRNELSRLNQEAKTNQDQISSLEKKINEISAQLKASQDLSAEQKRLLEVEMAALKKQKEDLDAQLKALSEKQAATEKQLEEAKKQAANAGSSGSSGNPLCGAVYYGDAFVCNGKMCGKSDPEFKNMCEITVNSKPFSAAAQNGGSGFPFCGSIYYGDQFDCNGKKCGKSDSAFKNICEITSTSKPFQTNGNEVGLSGYPYCPAPRFGVDFNCNNGKKCAKSDPEYKNICEIR